MKGIARVFKSIFMMCCCILFLKLYLIIENIYTYNTSKINSVSSVIKSKRLISNKKKNLLKFLYLKILSD